MKDRQQFTNALLAVLACLLWSTAFPAVRVTVNEKLLAGPPHPFFTAGIRFIISGCMLIPFSGGLKQYIRILKTKPKTVFLLSLTQTAILYGLFFYGMTLIKGALGAIIIGASPLVAAVIAHFTMHDDKMTWKRTLSICIGISGIVLLSIHKEDSSTEWLPRLIGILCLFGATVSSAFGNIIVSRDREELHPIALNSLQIFLGGCMLFLLSLAAEGFPTFAYPPVWYGALLWLSFISSVGFSLWFILLKRPGVKVSGLNVWKFLIPAAGAALSWLLLPDESPETGTVIGMILVSLSIIFFNMSTAGEKNIPPDQPE